MNETFKNRVANFWKTFVKEESQVREMMDNKAEGETLLNFVDSILQTAFHKSYFEMGKNSEGKHELILTPEGNRAKLMQLHYWLKYAPTELWEKWNFYSSKPGKANPGSTLEMFGVKIDDSDLIIYPEIDNKRSKINIEIHAPKLAALEENQRYSMLFIYLDQFIGELYTMEYIGYVDFVADKLNKTTVPISELATLIENSKKENEWPLFEDPCEIYSGYQMEPSDKKDWKLREDIMSGYTSCTNMLNAYYNGNRELLDLFEKDGVVFGFLFFENTNVPRETIVNFRAEIEDKIIAEAANSGIANGIGGATGFHFSYIDFIIFDIDAFLKIAKEVLSQYKFEEMGFSPLAIDNQPTFF